MTKTPLLTGAEAIAYILEQQRVKYVFAYPGTSELALCNAIEDQKGLTLINGRGDKESAFMAAGGSLLEPLLSVAILHGARGLTNATGAIADANRNEIPTLFITGLPSSTSIKFLPPHGDRNLIASTGNFVKSYFALDSFDHDSKNEEQAKRFITNVYKLFSDVRSLPKGPALLGVHQDVAEKKWIPSDLVEKIAYLAKPTLTVPLKSDIKIGRNYLKNSKKPLILIDDILFKNLKAEKQLAEFAQMIQAQVLQIKYLRGPMLFERVRPSRNPYFVGSYDLENPVHQKLMSDTDLLIMIEDRNGYSRVVGQLPNCRKIAITSNEELTKKNEYLRPKDLCLIGDIASIMDDLGRNLTKVNQSIDSKFQQDCSEIFATTLSKPKVPTKYQFLREGIATELGVIFSKVKNPTLVDDSQMFGGVLNENYDLFPSNLRVFGDHGAFIGGGLALANGLARCNTGSTVFCTVGDQSFTNALQSLIAAIQDQINVTYIVCNNGQSVSLRKQALSDNKDFFKSGSSLFLHNVDKFEYSALTKALGVKTYCIDARDNPLDSNEKQKQFRKYLEEAVKTKGPKMIELRVSSEFSAWEGIWAIKGNEQTKSSK